MEKIALMIDGRWLMVKKWIRENRGEAVILALILLIGAFFRLYKIDQYMTFLGDEGRDAIIVRKLLVNADLILVGPGTSIGNMYLGPIYYYIMAPALLLANYSPIGPAVMIALLGVATTFFVWFVAREWFPSPRQARGKLGSRQAISIAGLVAAGLYAISPIVIVYSRSSWNPNIMPFFALLTIYSLWRVWQKGAWKWLIVLGISYAFVLQSHYLGLLLAPTISLFWLITLLKIRQPKTKNFLRFTVYSLLIFASLMSPLIIFDARYGWRNFTAIKTFFTERQTTVSARPWTAFPKLWPIIYKVSTRLVAGMNNVVGKWVSVGAVAVTAWITIFHRKKLKAINRAAYLLLGVWLFFALTGLGVYKQEIYDHYYGFFFTAPFLLVGGLSQYIADRAKNIGKIVVFITFVLLVYVNLQGNPLKYSPNRQLQRSIEVSKKIVNASDGKKFNLAVIAERNYEGAYQYFLEVWRAPIVMIDPQRVKDTIADQLFVVCELPEEKCDPTRNSKAQVANFGWSRVDAQWEVGGVILYKLVHYK